MSHPIQLRRRGRQRAKGRRAARMQHAYRDPMLLAFGLYVDGSGYLHKKPERMAVEARGEPWFPELMTWPRHG